MGLSFLTSHRNPVLVCLLAAILAAVPSFGQEPAPPLGGESDLLIYAVTQEARGSLRLLRGDVELQQNGVVLKADEVDYNEESGEVEARGNVRYQNPENEEDLFAERFSYNAKSGLGTFYAVRGTVSSATQAGPRVLSTDNPFYIEGKVVHKTREGYVVTDGFVTNCDPSHPWWTFRSKTTRVIPNESATIRRGVFRLKGVPLFYFPYFRKSLERLPRQSGFLTPNIGNSSRFGFVLGQSYFWAINRSYDATVSGTWYTDRGFATQVGFRGRPTRGSTFDASFFGVKDRGFKLDDGRRIPQGGKSFSMRGSAQFPGGFRGVTQINYLSSLEFKQAFTQSYDEAVFAQVRSIGFVTKSFSTYSFNTSLQRDQNFRSVEPADTIILRKLPNIEFNSREKQILEGPLPLWLAFDTSFDLVSRTQPLFQTRRFVQRGDLYPRLSSNFEVKGFEFTPTFGARQTSYGQSRRTGSLVGENLYRTTKEFSLEIVPPSLQRIYNRPKFLGDRVKHVIEPRLTYRFVDGVEDFDRVIRFDDRDLIHNTNEAEISLTNRLYAKNDKTGEVREVFAVDVWQRRYFDADFGGAIVPGRRNVLRSSLDTTPFAFLSEPRSYSPVVSTVRIRPTWRYGLEWRNDYDPLRGKLVNSSVNGVFLFDGWNLSLGHNAVRSPTVLTPPSNQFSTTVRFGDFNRRGWNVAFSSIYDYRQAIFIYNTSQVTYNTDCCGFSMEVRRFAIGRTRNENQFRLSLSIANVGSFGTLRPQERLF